MELACCWLGMLGGRLAPWHTSGVCQAANACVPSTLFEGGVSADLTSAEQSSGC